ncbi:MAG: LA2681 family HEPN domain-containing protein [Eubacteriales bacterium]|nr:LA2681 family HEPN domain-containing protein [Eubacteriales bacterium]
MSSEKYINPFSEMVLKVSMQFDDAILKNDTVELRRIIEEVEPIIPHENIASQAQLYYSIGTAYGDIANITSVSDEELIKKQLYYFRKSIALMKHEELSNPKYAPYVNALKMNLYTNYGNTFDHCGRKLAAIEQYKKALKIRDDFGMALGNLGMAYKHYGMLVSDSVHSNYFHHFAYNLLNQAIKSNDPNTHQEAKNYFIRAASSYDSEYVHKFLEAPLEIHQYSYSNKEEFCYREWALKNNLFLNPLNDLPVDELCFAADVIQLPKMLANLDDKPIFHGMFNQFKQEFIYARYQYYCSQQVTEEVNFADKDTYLLNFADYPQYSIRIEILKSTFKTLYSLLDKIAFFLNSYFKLGIRERDVNFHSIWYSEKKGKYKYQNTLDHKTNFALASMYWIAKDFYEEFVDSPNPQAKRIRDIRNALEHKYVKVYWDLWDDRANGDIDDLAFYMSEAELICETFNLLKLIREVIVCLALSVGIEEGYRHEKLDPSKLILPTLLMDYQDEWKM